MNKKNVLLIKPTIDASGVALLEENVNVYYAPDGNEETLIHYINKYNIHAVLTRMETITDRIIEQCPSLELIGKHGIGVDNISEKATEENIAIINIPNGNITSVVEYTFSTMLALTKHLKEADHAVRNGNWAFREQKLPTEINGKTILLVGMGTIGQQVARMANAFNMRVLGFDPFISKELMQSYYAEKVTDFDQALQKADFIDIHVPLNKQTKNLLDTEQFKKMKKSAIVINASRGGVVNETALYNALNQKEIAAAAVDVFECEPPSLDNKLFSLDNILFSPHTAGVTKEAKVRSAIILARDTVLAMSGKRPINLVNTEILAEAKFLRMI